MRRWSAGDSYCQRLLRAARLLGRTGAPADAARDLASRLYVTCERKGWARQALAYNALVIAWPEIAH
jgi:putative DNA methylase